MSAFAKPRVWLWTFRLVPPIFYLSALGVQTVEQVFGRHSREHEIASLVFMLCFAVWLLVVFYLMPVLFFEGEYKGLWSWQCVGWCFFGGLTLGIGPMIWYFHTADRALRKMIAGRNKGFRETGIS